MEYTAALEEKANVQAERIIDLEASVDGQTVLTEVTNFAASTVTTRGANKDLKDLHAMMKQLTASITTQSATFESLSTKTNSGGNGGGEKNTEKKKSWTGLNVCAHCKRELYHKEGNFL